VEGLRGAAPSRTVSLLQRRERDRLALEEDPEDVAVAAVADRAQQRVAGNFFFLSMWTEITSWMSIVNSTQEPRNGMMRALNSLEPFGWIVSSKTTPGERCSCETMTRSAPLTMKVPSGVSSGRSPR
jgi:hypothetical protein